MNRERSLEEGLTDLEAVTLGWIRAREPATPYAVRVHIERSPAARFSGSAGAIYPLMRRLERRGLLSSEPVATGQRRGRGYRVTREGKRALKHWLKSGLQPGELFSFDPLRTRMIYLNALSSSERKAWLNAVETAIEAQLPLVAAYEAESEGDVFLQLANDHARREIRARLAWIRSARKTLEAMN